MIAIRCVVFCSTSSSLSGKLEPLCFCKVCKLRCILQPLLACSALENAPGVSLWMLGADGGNYLRFAPHAARFCCVALASAWGRDLESPQLREISYNKISGGLSPRGGEQIIK